MRSVALEIIRSKDYYIWEYRNCDCSKGDKPCVICGKTIKGENVKSSHWLRMYEDGEFLSDDMEREFSGDMGCFPVGESCYKRFLKISELKK